MMKFQSIGARLICSVASIIIRDAALSFPLTLTLSPGEREQLQPSRIRSSRVDLRPARQMILPLLGETAGVRGTRRVDFTRRRIFTNTESENHVGTITPESPSPAQVSPLNAGTSLAISLNRPSMVTNPFWPVTLNTSSCRNSHSGRL